ncbi:lysophospholipid acyltransferase family protein [Paenibacillus thermotolerans]|uniref:lysophospholipid acyltransferase family protein n=1 Tax=Paenibacillus thermotolerans TaxID=3027807 RepID=UPI002367CF47|nr:MULTISPECIES: lysophospholipid acyltransferase family protein [unclassified Paenibacillus]
MYKIAQVVLRIIFWLLFRLKAVGAGNIPMSGPVIVCCNHRNLLDPPIVGCPLPRKMRFMAKAELFKVPVFSQIIRYFGAFPVKRGGMSKETIKTTLNLLRDNQVLCIFPEGSRNADLGEGKKGAATFAIRTNAMILPAAIIGNYKLFRPLKVVYGQPFYVTPPEHLPAAEQLEAATEQIMASIRELIERHS